MNLEILNEPQNQNQLNQQFLDLEPPFGPIELNILERVESGLDNPGHETEEDPKPQATPPAEKSKYVGTREVIFVSGWINVASGRFFQ